MARRRRFTRRRLTRQRPSAFAPAKLRDGRSLTWEGFDQADVANTIANRFINLVPGFPLNSRTLRYAVLLPANVTRGVVTLERIRGYSNFALLGGASLNNASFMFAAENIQLVPVRDGVILDDAVLNPLNTADVESNRIIWRRMTYYPAMSGQEFTDSVGGRWRAMYNNEDARFDVRSKRRFDRALWGMIHAINFSELDIAAQSNYKSDIRCLFRSPDGL